MKRIIITLIATLLAAAGLARAQATYTQNFDNLAGGWQALESQGWIFRTAKTGGQYVYGFLGMEDGTFRAPFQGAGCWYTGISIAPPGTVANWTVLPPIPNLIAGDTLRFYCYASPDFYGYPGTLEVRYSSGGTNTGGTSPTATGDFGTVLASFPNASPNQWFPVTLTVPGNGRIALRHFMAHQSGFQGGTAFWIDSLAFNPAPSGPPFPLPGQTVHWTIAMSPITLSPNETVIAGGTVVIDPGVTVNLGQLNIAGTVHAQGIAGQPVTIRGTTCTILGGGRLLFDHASVDARIDPQPGTIFGSASAELIATASTFFGRGSVEHFIGQNLSGRRAFLSFTDCDFSGVQLQHNGCQALVRNCTFNDGGQWGVALDGYSKVQNLTLDNTQLRLTGGEIGGGLMYINDISVRNYADGGGLYLDGGRSFHVGPNTTLEGNLYPVEFGSGLAGLTRGSTLPAFGNINNYIADTDYWDPGALGGVWAKLSIPYVVRIARYVSNLAIDPGATILFMPGASWMVEGKLLASGTPDEPITFDALSPGQPWDNIVFGGLNSLPRLDHCIVRNASRGVGTVESALAISNSLFENCGQAIRNGESGVIQSVAGSTFRNNGAAFVSIFSGDGSGPFTAGSPTSPNIIEGNTLGVKNHDWLHNPVFNLAHNWWGSPTGPTYSQNPGGSGDAIDDGGTAFITFAPFLTQRPDLSDPPPTVRMVTRLGTPEPGAKVIVHWTAQDNGTITRQRILFSQSFNNPSSFQVLADNLPGAQRAFEFTVPNIGFNAANVVQSLRIEATDDRGRTGYDETSMYILTGDLTGTFTFTSDLTGPFTPGSPISLTWTHTFPFLEANGMNAAFEANGMSVSWGGASLSLGSLSGLKFLTDQSTDFARLSAVVYASLNRVKVFYSQPFTIRPDPRIGDAAPVISITSPTQGSSFSGGSVIPLFWTASDDEALRDFTIVASYDGGREYHTIAADLPASARSYAWQLPASTGIPDVRLRVIARDLRFQSSSSGVSLVITSGQPGPSCYANCDGSTGAPLLTANDFVCFINAYASGAAYANCDGSTGVPALTANDFTCFLNRFAAGCT